MAASLSLFFPGEALPQAKSYFWDPAKYPTLTPGRAFHVFDSKQQPLQMPELNDRQIFQLMIVAAYCDWQKIDFKDELASIETLQRCDWNSDKDPQGKPKFFIRPEWARLFLEDVQIVDHYPNDASGFSATLMRNRHTGKHTFVARGIEFKEPEKGGDSRSDLSALSQIRSTGLALAQISSARKYLESLFARGTLKKGERIDMAGEDIGAHVCFVLNEMFPGLVDRIVTVDAVGYLKLVQ